jgi:hypothetical protein
MSGLEMRYFVLKPRGHGPYARASRAAMRRYADLITGENPELAADLRKWADRELNEDWDLTNAPEKKP